MGSVAYPWESAAGAVPIRRHKPGLGGRASGAGRRLPREVDAGQAAPLVAAALEAVGVDAILCRSDGCILRLTGEAERLLVAHGLSLHGSRLGLTQGPRQLRGALAAAAAGEVVRVVAPATAESERPLVLRLQGLAFGPGVPQLVLVLLGSDRSSDPDAWRAAFNLTAVEAEVAAGVLVGRSPREIAAGRGVSLETVRSHLKTIYHKAGVNRAAQLVAVLRQYG